MRSKVETINGIEALHTKTRQQWRRWLEKNGQSKDEIALILYRKNIQAKGITYESC